MSHQHFCYSAGHRWQCNSQACLCICGFSMEEGDHAECPIELRACLQHEHEVGPAELEAVKEPGVVPIQFPVNFPDNLSSLPDHSDCVAFCVWCGFGYTAYSASLEAEHFAGHCPNAPEAHRQNALRRLHRCVT